MEPGRNASTAAGRSSAPWRGSTTTPSVLRSSPHIFSMRSASWIPSTQIRPALATRARVSPASIDPDGVKRRGSALGSPLRSQGNPDAVVREGSVVCSEGAAVPRIIDQQHLVAFGEGSHCPDKGRSGVRQRHSVFDLERDIARLLDRIEDVDVSPPIWWSAVTMRRWVDGSTTPTPTLISASSFSGSW